MNYQRFVVFVVSLLMCVAIGVTVYYFMKDEEYIYLKTQEVNVNVGDTFKLDFVHDNPIDSTKLEWQIKNTDLIDFDKETGVFTAKVGGSTEIWLNTNRKDWKIQHCFVNIGDGSSKNPFIVKDGADLQKIKAESDYILINDIDLGNEEWTPLCSNGSFAGKFNGNGYTIKNLKITSETENAGLFGMLRYTAYVHNLTLDGVDISGNFANVGAVAGVNNGLIEKVKVTNAKISSLRELSYAHIGGIAGVTQAVVDTPAIDGSATDSYNYSMFGRIDRCEVSNTVLTALKTANVGGLTAKLEGGFVLNSFFMGSIAGNASDANTIGAGIVAKMNATRKSSAKIKDNYAVVTFENVSNKAGVVYENKFGAYVDSENKLISENIIWGQYFDSEVCPDVEAVVNNGYASNEQFNLRKEKGQVLAKGVGTAQLKVSSILSHINYKGTEAEQEFKYDFVVTWKLEADKNNGYPSLQFAGKSDDGIINVTGTEKPPETIDPEDINETLRQKLQSCKEGEVVALPKDVDWQGKSWDAIQFNGILDGRGHKISNVVITGSFDKGFFSVLGSSAKVINITFENIKVANSNGVERVGIVAGINNGTISNVNVINMQIDGGKNIGGVVGQNNGIIEKTTIKNTNTAEFKGISTKDEAVERVGGICAFNNDGTITECSSGIELTVTKSSETETRIGGIAGENSGYITESTCQSNILTNAVISRVGGAVGYNIWNVNNVAYKGSITTNTANNNGYVGGLVGYNISSGKIYCSSVYGKITGYNVGGLVGYNANKSTNVYQCNVDNVSLVGERVGGLASTIGLGKFEDCSVIATITGLSEKSIKAGFAVVVGGSTDISGNGSCARVERCFAGVKYDGKGTNWAETESKVRVSLANSNSLKQGGFIKNCIYDSTLANGAKTQGGSTKLFGNDNSGYCDGTRYDNLDGRKSTNDCYKVATYNKDNRKWDNANIWTLGNNEYPKVKTAKTILKP